MARIGIENTALRYGAVGVLFHWCLAILIIVLAGVGLYMVRLPDAGFNTIKIALIVYHKEVGMLVLALVALRLAWRIVGVIPEAARSMPDWQKIAARFVHLSFYALMFALPMTGWLMSSAAGLPVSFLEWFTLPDLISQNDYVFKQLIEIHKWLAYALIFFVFVHMGAALAHHFLFKDDTLRSMLP